MNLKNYFILRGGENTITFYTTHCPKCKILSAKLDAAKIQYNVCDDVDKMTTMGMLSAPQLDVDGNMLDFYSAVKWINIHNNN